MQASDRSKLNWQAGLKQLDGRPSIRVPGICRLLTGYNSPAPCRQACCSCWNKPSPPCQKPPGAAGMACIRHGCQHRSLLLGIKLCKPPVPAALGHPLVCVVRGQAHHQGWR